MKKNLMFKFNYQKILENNVFSKRKNIYCIENYLEINYVNYVNLNNENCYYYDSFGGKLPTFGGKKK